MVRGSFFAVVLCLVQGFLLALSLASAQADDGAGLRRGGNSSEVSLSGLSSGAAMAVQYAVAHSASVTAVGSIAGPQWGCADGRVSRAINDCMCGRRPPLAATVSAARGLASSGAIDSLSPEGPRALRRAFVFQSPKDETVRLVSGRANVDFLTAFLGTAPALDLGNGADHSDQADHGIIAPGTGNDACSLNGPEPSGESFVRTCGAEDNAGSMFHAFFGVGTTFDPGKRAHDVAESEIWAFDQGRIVDRVKAQGAPVSADFSNLFWFGMADSSGRRTNFDMAATGYLYVPPSCRTAGSRCRVHVALHGCKQDAKRFALKAGYNNWAEHYRIIVVYPAIAPERPVSGSVCGMDPVPAALDAVSIKPNPNGCWDWWGYLDPSTHPRRYLTKRAPQMQVIEGIIADLTAPVP